MKDHQKRPLVWPWVCALLFLCVFTVVPPPARRADGKPQSKRIQACPADSSWVDVSPVETTVEPEPSSFDSQHSAAEASVLAANSNDRQAHDSVASGEEPALSLVSIEANPRIGNIFRVDAIGSSMDLRGPALRSAKAEPPLSIVEVANVPSRKGQDTPAQEVDGPPPSTEDFSPQSTEAATEEAAPPCDLLARLTQLEEHEPAAPWARRVGSIVRKVTTEPLRQDETQAILIDLRREMEEGARQVADKKIDPSLGRLWRRTQHAVARRAGVWQASLSLDDQPQQTQLPQSSEHLASAVAGLDGAISKGTHAKKWREFLLLDALQELARNRQRSPLAERTLARRVLSRLELAQASADRRAFLASAPVDKLTQQLQPLTIQPVERRELLDDIDRYELTALPSDARQIADARLRLISSKRPADQQLAAQIDDGYRACNFRLAITGDLLNKLLPQQQPTAEPVNTMIVGVPVVGQSFTQTRLAMELVPDPHRLRLSLVARGNVDASTTASSGPVDLVSRSNAQFEARKPLEFNLQGITYGPAQATVASAQQLRGVRTNFDNVPLLGSLVRNIAMDEHDNKSDQAKMETEWQIRQRAEQQLDESAAMQLANTNKQLQARMLVPLRRLSLDKSPTLLETTPKRMVIRARLATDEQLAAHTPRPQAPADSLASMQMHQTAFNNVLEQLELNGQSYHGAELMHHVAKKFNRDNPSVGEEIPESMRITFVENDPIRARLQDGRVELNLSIAELELERKQWKNMRVRVFYILEPNGNTINLVRDGTIELAANRLTMRSQLMLRGLFARIFSEEASWSLMGEQFASNPALQATEFSQVVVEDGWLSVALTPKRPQTAARPVQLR